jgi:hypothetical protein
VNDSFQRVSLLAVLASECHLIEPTVAIQPRPQEQVFMLEAAAYRPG